MRTRRLGKTDLELTTVGLGTWAIGGGGWQYAWGSQDDDESVAAIRRAVDLGINWVDTAPVYGCGHSEEVVGRALAGMKDRPVIATKCGINWDSEGRTGRDLRGPSIRAECEASLARLGVERIDLYQIHWPNPEEQIEEAWAEIARLVEEGKVRCAGVSNFSPGQLERIRPIMPPASLQPPYSMIRRDTETDLLPYCAQHGMGVVCYSPMQKGLLTGRWTAERVGALDDDDHRRGDPDFDGARFETNMALARGLAEVASTSGHTSAQLAIAWVLRRSEVTAAIVGARRPEQIAETAAAGDWELGAGEIEAVEKLLAERDETLAAI